MAETQADSAAKRILVIAGTGAQGRIIVPELVRDGKYIVTILTRNPDSPIARSLAALNNVILIRGSFQSDEGLRAGLKGQYGVYVNFNSFDLSEGQEYYWTFRLYDIAVQSGVKHLVYSGLVHPSRAKQRLYAEEYRNSHILVMGRIAEWIAAQPTSIISWTILMGEFYTEMLSAFLPPRVTQDGSYTFSGPTGNGYMAFTELAQYGPYTRWIFDNPTRSVGQYVGFDRYYATLQDVAEAFTRVTGKRAIAVDITNDEWVAEVKGYPTPDAKIPWNTPGDEDDGSRISFRQSFTGFWNIYRSLTSGDKDRPTVVTLEETVALADEIYPNRLKSVEEWMRATGFTGEVKAVMKKDEDIPVYNGLRT